MAPSPRRKRQIILALSALLFLLDVFLVREAARYQRDGSSVEAHVTRLDEESDPARQSSQTRPCIRAVFEYLDMAGASHEVHDRSCASSPLYSVGQLVRLRVLPGRPADAKIDSVAGIWGSPMIVSGFLVLLCVSWLLVGKGVER